MEIAGGSRIFWGLSLEDKSQEHRRKILRDYLKNIGKGTTSYKHLAYYDAGVVEPFDFMRFIFREGVEPVQALRCVVATR